ncbi:MAG: hypothetical protein ACEPO8_09210 [Rhodothermaceae bacterium]
MKLTGKENHKISLEDARRFTSGYRAEKAEFMKMGCSEHKEAKKGGFFGKEALMELLNQPGCIGMRYYYGRSDDDMKNLILVGVNEDGNDILLSKGEKQRPPIKDKAMAIHNQDDDAAAHSEAIILERSVPCPPWCSDNEPGS